MPDMTLSMDRAELLRSNKEKKEKVGGSESGGSRPSTSGGSRPSTSSSSSSAYCRSEPATGAAREVVQAPQPFRRKRLMQPKPTYGCPHCAYRCWTSEEMRRHAVLLPRGSDTLALVAATAASLLSERQVI